MFCEPAITIYGNELTIGQSMTIRLSLEAFATSLTENGLGDDEISKAMVKEYKLRIDEIRDMIYKGNEKR